ncbi:anti-sigma factor family protein [Paenibacillus radicis (ex Xue et al. 2023)]|uniref:Zf-HC2 domain-containing protein n=1 Tax=Paenibacillus radicis (ex Xue et al. 2023) TaxID=2972489 RepID=A0ABT1YN76_9BACL|nr:zf-HC2 domain-containing protein [Paenibacillus radicis (ex Xue et al. 2023)]MCR8634482.1 zf-HC2 domain-containing protein [Paenibacillus radicis (ex Xue et al. 2023)]
MMKCDDIQELFGVYWDLPEHDLKRQRVDEHIKHCDSCQAEFEIWLESTELIKSAASADEYSDQSTPISRSVMNRIYEDEGWRVPVADRLYAISFKLRRNITAAIAFCLALFIFSFIYSITHQPTAGEVVANTNSSVFGRIGDPVVIASSKTESMNVHTMPSAVASLKGFNEPFMYQVGPIHTYQDYMLFLSLLGLTSTLLVLNWLSRTRS